MGGRAEASQYRWRLEAAQVESGAPWPRPFLTPFETLHAWHGVSFASIASLYLPNTLRRWMRSLSPFRRRQERQCQVQCHSHLEMSHDQTTGLCEPGAPAFEVHTLLRLVVRRAQAGDLSFLHGLTGNMATHRGLSSVKWGITIPISPPYPLPRPLVKTWAGGHGEELKSWPWGPHCQVGETNWTSRHKPGLDGEARGALGAQTRGSVTGGLSGSVPWSRCFSLGEGPVGAARPGESRSV